MNVQLRLDDSGRIVGLSTPPSPKRRRRKVLLTVLAALALPAVAVAAWIVYTGVEGSGSGSFDSAEVRTAFTVTGTSSPTISPDTGTVQMNVNVTNNDPQPHALDTVTGTFTSSPPECAAHMTFSNDGIPTTVYAGGETKTGTVGIATDASTPSSCASGTWSVSFAGTTTP